MCTALATMYNKYFWQIYQEVCALVKKSAPRESAEWVRESLFGIEVKSGLLKRDERRDQKLRAHKGGFGRLLRYYGHRRGRWCISTEEHRWHLLITSHWQKSQVCRFVIVVQLICRQTRTEISWTTIWKSTNFIFLPLTAHNITTLSFTASLFFRAPFQREA